MMDGVDRWDDDGTECPPWAVDGHGDGGSGGSGVRGGLDGTRAAEEDG